MFDVVPNVLYGHGVSVLAEAFKLRKAFLALMVATARKGLDASGRAYIVMLARYKT